MRTKICSYCKQEKRAEEFYAAKRTKDRLTSRCKVCMNAAAVKSTRRTIENKQDIVYAYLLTHPCIVCGESDPIVLEFDHRKGVKKHTISKLATQPGNDIDALRKEMAKCAVMCKNCHQRKTAREGNSYRYRRSQEQPDTNAMSAVHTTDGGTALWQFNQDVKESG